MLGVTIMGKTTEAARPKRIVTTQIQRDNLRAIALAGYVYPSAVRRWRAGNTFILDSKVHALIGKGLLETRRMASGPLMAWISDLGAACLGLPGPAGPRGPEDLIAVLVTCSHKEGPKTATMWAIQGDLDAAAQGYALRHRDQLRADVDVIWLTVPGDQPRRFWRVVRCFQVGVKLELLDAAPPGEDPCWKSTPVKPRPPSKVAQALAALRDRAPRPEGLDEDAASAFDTLAHQLAEVDTLRALEGGAAC